MAKNKEQRKRQTSVIATRVSNSFKESFESLAKKEARTVGNMIYVVLRDYMIAKGVKCQ